MILSMKIKEFLKAWRDEEDGSVAVETVLMVPLMAWAYIGTLTFFDAYQHEAISFKANLTIADMFSREPDYVTPEFIDGAEGLLEFLSRVDPDPDLRVTAFRWIEDDQQYISVWSQERGPRDPLTTADLVAHAEKLPIMSDGEMALLVETWVEYDPPWEVGIESYTRDAFTVISPRFTTQLCYNTGTTEATAVC